MKKKPIKIGKYIFYKSGDVFRSVSKLKEFRDGVEKETARFNLIYKVREAREAKKLTQKALALKTGMSQSVIARIESGRKGLSLTTLSRVASALGKEISLV